MLWLGANHGALNLANIEVNRKEAYEAQMQIATKNAEGQYDEALQQLTEAQAFADPLDDGAQIQLEGLQNQWTSVQSLVRQGDN